MLSKVCVFFNAILSAQFVTNLLIVMKTKKKELFDQICVALNTGGRSIYIYITVNDNGYEQFLGVYVLKLCT